MHVHAHQGIVVQTQRWMDIFAAAQHAPRCISTIYTQCMSMPAYPPCALILINNSLTLLIVIIVDNIIVIIIIVIVIITTINIIMIIIMLL